MYIYMYILVYETRCLHKPVGHIIEAAGNSRRVVGCSSSLLSGILSRDSYKDDTQQKHYDLKACLMQRLLWFLVFNNKLISFIKNFTKSIDVWFLKWYMYILAYFKVKSYFFFYKILKEICEDIYKYNGQPDEDHLRPW